MIKKSYVPFYQSLFFCFSSLLLLPCQKTFVFRFFSINSQVTLKNSRPLASNFSILLSNLLKKKSQYKSFTTRKQQQLGENKKIRLWSIGNSYFNSVKCALLLSTYLLLWKKSSGEKVLRIFLQWP